MIEILTQENIRTVLKIVAVALLTSLVWLRFYRQALKARIP